MGQDKRAYEKRLKDQAKEFEDSRVVLEEEDYKGRKKLKSTYI